MYCLNLWAGPPEYKSTRHSSILEITTIMGATSPTLMASAFTEWCYTVSRKHIHTRSSLQTISLIQSMVNLPLWFSPPMQSHSNPMVLMLSSMMALLVAFWEMLHWQMDGWPPAPVCLSNKSICNWLLSVSVRPFSHSLILCQLPKLQPVQTRRLLLCSGRSHCINVLFIS